MHHNSDGSTDFGVFQLNSVHFRADLDPDRVFDAAYNIQYAFQMWQHQGNWHAWTTHTACGL